MKLTHAEQASPSRRAWIAMAWAEPLGMQIAPPLESGRFASRALCEAPGRVLSSSCLVCRELDSGDQPGPLRLANLLVT